MNKKETMTDFLSRIATKNREEEKKKQEPLQKAYDRNQKRVAKAIYEYQNK